MSDDRSGDSHEKQRHPASASRLPAGREATPVTAASANNPPGLFEHVMVERRPSFAREEWYKVRIVCTVMRHVPTGRTPQPDELREAAAAAAATVLILHFPEGPRGAQKAQRAYCKWLENLGAEPRPAAARWQAAMREIRALERDQTQPNYLTHIDALHGVDFSGVGRGLNLRSRHTAREEAKIWSALSWRKTPDGSYLRSRNNRPMARLVPNWDEQFGDGWLSHIEKRFEKLDYGCGAVDFTTAREGKAFLERWAMGISEREFRRCGGRPREEGLER
jgi:hypothetical protein